MSADLKYVRCLNGMVPQTEIFECAEAIEAGDLVAWATDEDAVDKATASHRLDQIVGLAQDSGSDGDDISVLMLVDGMILEGTVNTSTGKYLGQTVGITTDGGQQKFDTSSLDGVDQELGVFYKHISDSKGTDKTIQVRMFAPMAHGS